MPSSEFSVPVTGAPLTEARTYQLHIQLESRQKITVGRLGRFTFEKGQYL